MPTDDKTASGRSMIAMELWALSTLARNHAAQQVLSFAAGYVLRPHAYEGAAEHLFDWNRNDMTKKKKTAAPKPPNPEAAEPDDAMDALIDKVLEGEAVAVPVVHVRFNYQTRTLQVDNPTPHLFDVVGEVIDVPEGLETPAPPAPPPAPLPPGTPGLLATNQPRETSGPVSALDELRGAVVALHAMQKEIPAAELEQLPAPEQHLARAMFAALNTYQDLLRGGLPAAPAAP